jgi:hypothetical protein
MKKLIGIVAGLALIGSLSFAACAEAVSVGSAVEGMTTTYDAETGYFTTTVNANVGDQATILAFTGETLTTDNGTNIEYINQESKGETTSFTYLMKSDVAEGATYTVKIGGSDINTPYSQKITIPTTTQEPAGYTVSGAVSNFVEQDFYDMLVADELIAAEDLDTYKAAYGTTAYLVDLAGAEEFAGNYSDVTEFTYLAKAEVSAVDGTYSFADLEAGEYAVIITRDGALPYMEYATVEDADVDMGTIDMIFGDTIGAKDFLIDGGDVGEVVAAISDITEEIFVPACDVIHDCLIDGSDVGEFVANIGDITAYGTNLILDFFG